MPAKKLKAVAEALGIYHVGVTENAQIKDGDDFKGRLRPDDWALFVGQGRYIILIVDGHAMTGKPEYVFSAKPLGIPITWKPSAREALLLQAGETILAPMRLHTLVIDEPVAEDAGARRAGVPVLPMRAVNRRDGRIGMAQHDPYTEGKRRAYLNMLNVCLQGLGLDDPTVKALAWVTERQEALAVLRHVCEKHGDNEWDDDLELADIIDKHLSPYLDRETEV